MLGRKYMQFALKQQLLLLLILKLLTRKSGDPGRRTALSRSSHLYRMAHRCAKGGLSSNRMTVLQLCQQAQRIQIRIVIRQQPIRLAHLRDRVIIGSLDGFGYAIECRGMHIFYFAHHECQIFLDLLPPLRRHLSRLGALRQEGNCNDRIKSNPKGAYR